MRPEDKATILAALDEAAEAKRDAVANCDECTDRSCDSCRYRLATAREYEALRDREAGE